MPVTTYRTVSGRIRSQNKGGVYMGYLLDPLGNVIGTISSGGAISKFRLGVAQSMDSELATMRLWREGRGAATTERWAPPLAAPEVLWWAGSFSGGLGLAL